MIEEENEKIPLCPVCLGTLTTDFYFTSENHLHHRNCFDKLTFKSSLSRHVFSYYTPVNKVVNGKVYFEKKLKISSKHERKGFDTNGFNINSTMKMVLIEVKK